MSKNKYRKTGQGKSTYYRESHFSFSCNYSSEDKKGKISIKFESPDKIKDIINSGALNKALKEAVIDLRAAIIELENLIDE